MIKYKEKPKKEYILQNFKNIIVKKNLEQEKYIHQLYSNINYNFKSNDTMDFLTIVRNGEFYYNTIFPKIYKNICKHLNARFFIYENNSTDNTKNILNRLSKQFNNIFVKSENLVNLPKNRIKRIIVARNNLKEFYLDSYFEYPENNPYIILFDTDILFNYEITISRILSEAKKNDNFSMLLSYGIFAGYTELLTGILLKKENFDKEEIIYINLMLNYYYDTLALNYGEHFKKNTIEYFKSKDIINVKTGFGGLGLIKKGLFLTSRYDDFKKPINFKNKYFKEDMICEHWGFSERIRKFGNIYIVKSAECLWYQDRDIYKKDFKFYVKFFINNKGFNNIYK